MTSAPAVVVTGATSGSGRPSRQRIASPRAARRARCRARFNAWHGSENPSSKTSKRLLRA
eukprot:6945094-Lingulodinium_polyedra.AAC.1